MSTVSNRLLLQLQLLLHLLLPEKLLPQRRHLSM